MRSITTALGTTSAISSASPASSVAVATRRRESDDGFYLREVPSTELSHSRLMMIGMPLGLNVRIDRRADNLDDVLRNGSRRPVVTQKIHQIVMARDTCRV